MFASVFCFILKYHLNIIFLFYKRRIFFFNISCFSGTFVFIGHRTFREKKLKIEAAFIYICN